MFAKHFLTANLINRGVLIYIWDKCLNCCALNSSNMNYKAVIKCGASSNAHRCECLSLFACELIYFKSVNLFLRITSLIQALFSAWNHKASSNFRQQKLRESKLKILSKQVLLGEPSQLKGKKCFHHQKHLKFNRKTFLPCKELCSVGWDEIRGNVL